MIAEALIRDALTPPKSSGVVVKPHTRKPPLADRKQAINEALRSALLQAERDAGVW